MLSQCAEYLRTADSLEDDLLAELAERSGIRGRVLFRCREETLDASPMIGEAPALMLTVSAAEGAYACETAYDAAVYGDYTARGFSRLFAQISEEMLIRGTVGEIRFLSPEQKSELRNFYDTDWPVDERPAYRLLQDTAEKLPEKTALIAIDRTLCYRELNEEANAVGHTLRDAGAGPEIIVAVLAERNSWAYVMRQGVLKSGGAFMPVNPEYPDERIRYIIENSGAKLAVTTHEVYRKREALLKALSEEGVKLFFAEDAAARDCRENLNVEVPPEALAYVIYTSGSTGKPKGVMLTNRNLVHYADENPKNYETLAYTRHGSVSIAIAAFTFDVSITEEFIPFAHGMTNVLATREQTLDAVAMRDLILNNGVDAIDGTPSYYLNMLEIEAFLPAVRKLKMLDAGAEAFPAALYEKLAAINPDLYIVNTYGPTECTVSCTLKEVTDSRNITIGTPLSNMRMAILTSDGQIRAVRRDGLAFEPSVIPCECLPDDETLMRPFKLHSDGPLFRAEIYTTPKGNYFLLDTHHIVSDGVSIEILERDIERAYAGEKLEKERYTGYEFALDEEKAMQGSRYQDAKAFYDGVFSGINGETLPPQDGKKCGERMLRLRRRGTPSAQAVRDFCGKNGLTLNAFFTFAFGVALKAYTGSEEAVFSMIYNGRNDPRLTDTVCMLVKTLPVRLALEKDGNVLAGVEACRRYLVAAMANDVFDFSKIHDVYGITGDALFAYQGEFQYCAIYGGKPAALSVPVLSQAMSAIGVELYTDGDTLLYDGEIDPAKYSEYTLDGLMGTLDHVIGELLEKETLGEITLLSEDEEQKVRALHDTDFPVAERPAYRLLQDSAERLPEKTALIAVDRTLTYRELNEEANAVGHALRKAGAGPETIVAVLAERNSMAYVMRQDVLKSGAAFLPIDPDYPDERISFILEDSGAKLLIAARSVLHKREALFDSLAARGVAVIEAEDTVSRHERENLNLVVPYDALAYVIYTSGSTGKPKGVMLTNRNLVNFVDDNEKNREVQGYTKRGSVSLAIAALTFDFAIMEEFVPLANGMTVVLATQEQIMNPALLRELMLRNQVDVMSCTPGYLSNLAAIDSFLPAIRGLKSVDFGAEAFPSALFGKLRTLNPELYIMNGYGPTEATISCTMEALESGEDITIGIPNANVHVATLDRDGRLQPLGATGEMAILGEGVGRGYINRDDLTTKNFITLLGRRAYRSGDLVRLRRDGKIEFHGRLDNQVKLRGLRIELGEIESVLNSYPGVKSSIVVVNHEENCLAAYFTADAKAEIDDVKRHLSAYLTTYMVPQVIMQLDKMPLTPNGKIDKKALPVPHMEKIERVIVPPSTDLQRKICDMFRKALELDEVGVSEDFFALGGTSLKASVVLMSAMLQNLPITYQDIFDVPTAEGLEKLVLERQKQSDAGPELAEEKAADCLCCNTNAHLDELEREPLGNVLLTGAAGFLGIHVLRDLLENTDEKVYCLLRKHRLSPEETLKSSLYYYFETSYEELFGTRLFVIEGDITQPDSLRDTLTLDYRTVINCAACVKHFANIEFLKDVNLRGVENLTELCLEKGARLIQISTVSVAGDAVGGSREAQLLREDRFDMGQEVQSNAYVYTKYLAEKHILRCITEKGLDAKIIRAGNLSSRVRDGEFQMNFRTNAFMNSLRAYAVLGCYPLPAMSDTEEISYIDETARAVVLLAGTNRQFTVFHAYNSHSIEMGSIIRSMKALDIKIEVVKNAEFERRLRAGLANEKTNHYLAPLVNYSLTDDDQREEIPAENYFTTNVLYHLDFAWTITDLEIIKKMIESLNTLGFFDVN